MERVAKQLLVLTVALMVFASNGTEGARTLKVDEPQHFFGGIGRNFPAPPGFTGSFPSPGFGGSFPSPGFSFGPPNAGTFCTLFPGTIGCSPANSGSGSSGSAP